MDLLKSFKLLSLFFVLSVLASCSATDGNNSTAASSGTGRVTLLITDGITEDFDEVNLTVTSISFLGEDDGHETIVFDESRVINLLALQNYSDLLVTAIIPAGIYDKIRLHVTKVVLEKEGQDPITTKLPANGKVDLNPRGTFEVFVDGHLMIGLDIDAEKSIHIIKKGNGEYSYNFRPVVFVNILGVDDESKLVLLDGKVLARTENGFQLCDAEVSEADETCLAIVMTEDTVVQNDLIEAVLADRVENYKFVTVLGKADSEKVRALHIVIEADDKEVSDLALFSGDATSNFNVDHFTMDAKIDDDDVVIQPLTLTALTVALVEGSGVRVFDKYGEIVSAADSIFVGTAIDAFGMAQPDISKVKAAFIIVDNAVKADKISGTIFDVPETGSQITVLTDNYNGMSGEVCVETKDAIIFILAIVDGKVVSKEITIANLVNGMPIDVYGEDDGLGCVAADAILVAEPLAVAPVGASLLVTGN